VCLFPDGLRKEARPDREEAYVEARVPCLFAVESLLWIGKKLGNGKLDGWLVLSGRKYMKGSVIDCDIERNSAQQRLEETNEAKTASLEMDRRLIHTPWNTDTKRFNRHQSDRFMCVGASWRKPKGIDNRVRRRFKGQAAMPKVRHALHRETRPILVDVGSGH
jgi:hypothetical protein